jgi:tRNA-Thr(GGU) m(6)t(6)A37 methyltransferase TsaA
MDERRRRERQAMKEVTLRPIGRVSNDIKEHRFGGFADEVSEIILDEEFAPGLEALEDYSHVIVVYLFDRVTGYSITHRPQGNPKVPVVGIFACRCPNRPNHVGVTTVRLMAIQGNRLKVRGLDVLDGTPVLDIKPYWPQYDEVREAKVANWVNELSF